MQLELVQEAGFATMQPLILQVSLFLILVFSVSLLFA